MTKATEPTSSKLKPTSLWTISKPWCFPQRVSVKILNVTGDSCNKRIQARHGTLICSSSTQEAEAGRVMASWVTKFQNSLEYKNKEEEGEEEEERKRKKKKGNRIHCR